MKLKEFLKFGLGFFVLSLPSYLLILTGEFTFYVIFVGQIFFLILVLFSALAMKIWGLL